MKTSFRGLVHGKTIELAEAPGLPDGLEVRVTIEPVVHDEQTLWPPGEGLRRAFGAWSEGTDDLDKFLEWNREQRKVGRKGIAE